MPDFGINTTVGDATTALVAAAQTAVAGLDWTVDVYDGPPYQYTEPDYIIVDGFDFDERRPATFGGPRKFQIEEVYVLQGQIVTNRGSNVPVEARTAALTIFEALETAVRADPTLGGAVTASWLGKASGRVGGTANGVRAEIIFELTCNARVT